MNTFNWLLIAHMVGDWLLQNDWMAKGKRQGLFTRAGAVHFTIYTLTIIGALWCSGFSGQNPVFFLSISSFIFASHWLIDSTNVVDRWMHFYHQTNVGLVRIMVDQTLHLLVMVLLTLFFSKM